MLHYKLRNHMYDVLRCLVQKLFILAIKITPLLSLKPTKGNFVLTTFFSYTLDFADELKKNHLVLNNRFPNFKRQMKNII
ncbi:hypothetical protein BpHYR1_022882 [Brachionus plicatilis]|uniref:Uncharacterized protein n=1 Tax=Brachionus plicatilis TaxID=10195 RepID=A0A3M7Q806_BRAPC|nr:hypothetical protein BpHYR1_022882 [Brachionus plicatilis]